MIASAPGFAKAVEDAVARVEEATDAEVVVVVAERSGHYRDVSMAGACVLSLVTLVAVLLAPIAFHPWLVPVDLVVVWAASFWILDGRRVLGRVVPSARRAAQVRAAAESEFVRENVHATPHRTGVLVYASALEERVEVIADVGVSARVPPGELAPAIVAFEKHDLEGFLAGLARLGEALARGVPSTPESKAFDLPNAPRVRP